MLNCCVASQVVVVPVRMNVNLKSVTLEELEERKKVLAPQWRAGRVSEERQEVCLFPRVELDAHLSMPLRVAHGLHALLSEVFFVSRRAARHAFCSHLR